MGDLPTRARETAKHPRIVLVRVVGLLPETAVCVLLVLCVAAEAQLLVRSYDPWVTLLVGVLGGLTLAAALLRRVSCSTADAVGASLALLVSAAVALFNAGATSQWLSVSRDPGFYTVTARWLVDHPSPLISRSDSGFGRVQDAAAAGFTASGDVWYPQSSHLLPALAAIMGKLGDGALLGAGTVVGLFALLGLYAFSRLLVGPAWALVPMVAIGVSLPFAAFTRGLYTEPLAMAATMGALALTVRWVRSPTPLLAISAGALAGVPCMTRVDGLVVTIPLVVAMVLARAVARETPRRGSWAQELLFVLAAVTTSVMGLLELGRNSPQYLADLGQQVRDLELLAGAAAVFCLAVTLASRTSFWTRRVRDPAYSRLAVTAAGAVVVIMAVLAARPLFWEGHDLDPASSYAHLVASLQQTAGVPVDGTRSYDERSLEWISWYLGTPTVILASIGLALLAVAAVRRRTPGALLALVVVGSVSLLYLNRVSITPDQVWATRRFLPVVLPGFALAAVVPLALLARRGRVGGVAALVLSLVMALAPVRTLLPLARTPEVTGWKAPLAAVCAQVRGGRVLAGVDQPYPTLAVTIRVFCGAAVTPLRSSRAASLADVVSEVGPRVYVLTGVPLRERAAFAKPFVRVRSVRFERLLFDPPSKTATDVAPLYLARVTPDGRLVPLPPG